MVACNGIEYMKKSKDSDTKLSCLLNHFDTISTIDLKLQESPLLWDWQPRQRSPIRLFETTGYVGLHERGVQQVSQKLMA